MIPTIRFSKEELEQRSVAPMQLMLGVQVFRSVGVLLLENAFDSGFTTRLRDAYCERYRAYFRDGQFPDADTVGNGRVMITVALGGPFNTPSLYANDLVVPFIHQLLGQDCVLNSFGSVVALPGADNQHVHRDHPGLFRDQGLDGTLPPFAVNVLVPLVELNEHHGTTVVWKSSHRLSCISADAEPPELPIAPMGSCLLVDYRLFHGGTVNRSKEIRPVLYLIYSRPWFWDYVNFSKQPKLLMTEQEYEKVPERLRHWLSFLKQSGLRYRMTPPDV